MLCLFNRTVAHNINQYDDPHVTSDTESHVWTISYRLQSSKSTTPTRSSKECGDEKHSLLARRVETLTSAPALPGQQCLRCRSDRMVLPQSLQEPRDGTVTAGVQSLTWHGSLLQCRKPSALFPVSKRGDMLSEYRKLTWRRVTFLECGSGRIQYPADDTTRQTYIYENWATVCISCLVPGVDTLIPWYPALTIQRFCPFHLSSCSLHSLPCAVYFDFSDILFLWQQQPRVLRQKWIIESKWRGWTRSASSDFTSSLPVFYHFTETRPQNPLRRWRRDATWHRERNTLPSHLKI